MFENLKEYLRIKDREIFIQNCFEKALYIPPYSVGRLLAKLFIKLGADVNHIDPTNRASILQLAIKFDSLQAITILVEEGANVNYRHPNGLSVLDYAVKVKNVHATAKNVKIVDLLIKAGANVKNDYSALKSAMMVGSVQMVSLLVQAGADVNYIDPNGMPPLLHWAIRLGDVETITLVLKAGADLNYYAGFKDRFGSVLQWVVGDKYIKSVDPLIEAGADVNKKNYAGDSILQTAVEFNNLEAIPSLIKAGAEMDYVGITRGSMLGYAIYLNKVKAVKLLLALGNFPGGIEYGPARVSAEMAAILQNYTPEEAATALIEKAFILGDPYQGIVERHLRQALNQPFFLINYYVHQTTKSFLGLPTEVTKLILDFVPRPSILTATQLSPEAAADIFPMLDNIDVPTLINRIYTDNYHQIPSAEFTFKTPVDIYGYNTLFFINKLIANRNTIHYVGDHVVKPLLPEAMQEFINSIELPQIPMLAWIGLDAITLAPFVVSFTNSSPLNLGIAGTLLGAYSLGFAALQQLSPIFLPVAIAAKFVMIDSNNLMNEDDLLSLGYLAVGVLEGIRIEYDKSTNYTASHKNTSLEKYVPYTADVITLSLGSLTIPKNPNAKAIMVHGFSLLKTIALTHHLAEIAAPMIIEHMSKAISAASDYWSEVKEVGLRLIGSLDTIGDSSLTENIDTIAN